MAKVAEYELVRLAFWFEHCAGLVSPVWHPKSAWI
jgi:hypothetical protein